MSAPPEFVGPLERIAKANVLAILAVGLHIQGPARLGQSTPALKPLNTTTMNRLEEIADAILEAAGF